MKISTSWLADYVDHGLSIQELADQLTMCGLEVDEIIPVGQSLEGVVVGHVVSAEQHPNADRLRVCKVDLGDGDPVQIVCGAPNVAAGQRVPVATNGTTLMLPSREDPDTRVPVKVKRTKLRGEESNGMICAEDELGLGDEHDGILVLQPDATVGMPFADYLTQAGLTNTDTVLDIAITPNRPDAISHIGTARDVAALNGTALNRPDVAVPTGTGPVNDAISINIEAPEACRRYVGLLVRGVTIKESPTWMKQRLTAIGLRPRNNIVDITNYVMYECGQPLHAFDYDQIAGKRIEVRFAKEGDTFVTLDSKERKLPARTLMICDGERPVAIGGIMGGENSEVTDDTTNVLIEAGYFDPSTIRRTAKALGLQTDASYRFERGVDPEGQPWAAARAAQLMVELGGGTLVAGIADEHPSPQEQRMIDTRVARANAIVGINLKGEEMVRMLEAIGFEVALADGVMACKVPTFRPDIEREIDVIEEVARMYGFDNLPVPDRTPVPNILPLPDPMRQLTDEAREFLVGKGYRELRVNSMLRSEIAERFNDPFLTGAVEEAGVVETLKPISQEMAALRPTLLPGVLSVMRHNQNHGQRIMRFWELGHVFNKTEKSHTFIPGYTERESLILAMSGPAVQGNWASEERAADFADIRGLLQGLLNQILQQEVTGKTMYSSTPLMAYYTELAVGGRRIGVMARASDDLTSAYALREPVFFAELDWTAVLELASALPKKTYIPVSRFPVVDRDLALVLDQGQEVGAVVDALVKEGAPLLQNVTVFDVYQGDKVENDKKSVAFGLRFSADRTLKDKEVDKAVNRLLGRIEKEFNAVLRS